MSRAFVKESDGADQPDGLPDLPHSPHPNHITPAGLVRLRQRLDDLRQSLAALPGNDASSKGQRALLVRDIRYVEQRIKRAIVVDPRHQRPDVVAFGAAVTVEDEDGKSRDYTVVGEDETDAAQGRVSWVSPLARALLDAEVGDEVTWQRPSGPIELTVMAIRYPEAGSADAAAAIPTSAAIETPRSPLTRRASLEAEREWRTQRSRTRRGPPGSRDR